MMTWPLVPNWSSPLKETYAFKTEILTSRSGREQRLALRSTPRREISFTAMADKDRLRDLESFMAATRGATIFMPEFVRGVRTTTAIPTTGSTVAVDVVPDWLKPGAGVAVSARRKVESLTVESVVGNTVTFAGPSAGSWPKSSLLAPLAPGWLSDSLQARLLTSSISTPDVEFIVSPGADLPSDNAADAAFSYGGREIFMARPNWSTSPSINYGNNAEEIDYGRGRVARFLPVDFGTRTHQATYLRRTAADVDYLVRFFMRAKGQRGDFLHPTWQDDLPPLFDLTATGTTLVVPGRTVFDRYAEDAVHRTVAVVTKADLLVVRTIETITLVGGNSVLTMTQPWGVDRPRSTIRMVCWMPVCRFASDTLIVEWETDQIAQIAVATRTLESTPADPGAMGLDGAAEYLISTYGWAFAEAVLITPLHWAMNERLPEIFA